MKKLTSIILAIILLFNILLPTNAVHARTIFSDLDSTHWAFVNVNYLIGKKIINGFPDGSFKPSVPINRIDAAKMLVIALDLDTTNRPNPNFLDMSPGDYGYEFAATLAAEGIFTGRRGEFKPYEPLTRAEMAKVLTESFKLTFYHDAKFKDVPKDYWAFDYINKLAANDITIGKGNHMFAPNDVTTRAEFSVFLSRALDERFK